MMAHLKTFAKWIHKLRPFTLGNPMGNVSLLKVGNGIFAAAEAEDLTISENLVSNCQFLLTKAASHML